MSIGGVVVGLCGHWPVLEPVRSESIHVSRIHIYSIYEYSLHWSLDE
jgi:hypothetical protein